MYPVENKTLPQPYNNQKDEDIYGDRGNNGYRASIPLVVNIGPLNWTQTLMVGRTLLQGKERGQCPLRGLGLAQPPNLVEQLHTHL